jgi:hypothetical protein
MARLFAKISIVITLVVLVYSAQADRRGQLLNQKVATVTSITNPTDIPNLYRWYDAAWQSNYIDGDFIDSTLQWTNRAYAGDNIYGAGGARPTFRTFIQNSLPGILFDGSDDVITMTTLPSQSQLTIVGVLHITQAHSTTTIGLLDDSAGNSEIWISATTGPEAFTLRVDDASDTLGESDAVVMNWTNAIMAAWAIDGTDAKFYVDGTNYGTDVDMGSIGAFTLDRMGAAAGIQFKGYMHEWMIYTNYKASATQIEQLWSNYVSNKWFAAPPLFVPSDESGLILWAEADNVTASDGDQLSQWDDDSGNNYHFKQATQILRPHYLVNQINGLPAIRFYGTNHYFNVSNVLNGLSLTAAEVFIITKTVADPAASAATMGLWSISGTDEDTGYTFTDGVIYDGFGSSARKTTGNPTLSLTSWRLYNVQTAANAWTNRIDGEVHYGTGVNTVDFDQTTHLHLGVSWSDNTYMMDGWIALIAVYDHVLSESARDNFEDYTVRKYGLSITP